MLKRHAGLMGPLCMCAGLALSTPAQAQSAYGCRNLETHAALPAVEGAEGTFFRITPDLQGHHGMADETIAQIATLSDTLQKRGTTLVLLPIPNRAQVLSHLLPPMARHVGYDPDISTTVHAGVVKRLQASGVQVADVRQPLRQAALAGERVFFESDPRPTSAGVRVMANEVGKLLADLPATKDLPRGTFTTTQNGEVTLPSTMRAQLQLACQDGLPELTDAAVKTVGSASAITGGILGVIGADTTATEALNMAGYLSEFSGLRAGGYGIAEGGAYAAISSYVTSRDFVQAPPAVLVWEFPVSAPFGLRGDQPMRELIAAAGSSCTQFLPLRPGENSTRVLADLDSLPTNRPITLAFDSDGAAATQAVFHFSSGDGQTRSRGIWRHADQILTGRFFLPLSGLQSTGLTRVEIELPIAVGAQPTLSVCVEGVSQ